MNFRPVMRWLKRLLLGATAFLAGIAVLITCLVYSDRHQKIYYREILISKQLGWSVRTDDREVFRQKVLAEPKRVLGLLQNEYPTAVRVAASQVLCAMREELPDEILDACVAELAGTSSYNKKDLFDAIRYDSERIVPRLLAVYRADKTVDPSLHALLCSGYHLHHSGELSEGLIKVMTDSSVRLDNRCLAAQALAYFGPLLDEFDEKKEVRLADYERMVLGLPEPVGGIARISLNTLRNQQSLNPRLLEFNGTSIQLPTTDHGQDAMLALTDQHDWLRTSLAAELLARHNIQTAIPELRKVVASYWYGPVRETAARAIAILEGREPGPTTPLDNIHRDSIIEKDLQQKALAKLKNRIGLHGEPTFYDKLHDWLYKACEPIFYDTIYWRFLPRVEEVKMQSQGRLPEVTSIRIKPRSSIDFAGGKLLGYDEGEFGSGTVFCRDGQMPEFFQTANVVGFTRMPFGVVIDCSVAMSSDHLLFLATEEKGGIVAVRFFMRLPDGMDAINRLPSGELLIGKGDNAVLIGLKGEIRAAWNAPKASEN